MEDLNNSTHGNWRNHSTSKNKRIPLGMSSFTKKDQRKFGESVRLSMALMDGAASAIPTAEKALPSDVSSIARRLKTLNHDISSALADQLELLVRFDELEGWKPSGARRCAAWMNSELGICQSLSYEYLRVGRKLRSCPIIRALFRVGQLTWSKVRLLTRVADDENEGGLCHAALDASVSQVERLCADYRWQDDEDSDDDDNKRRVKQWESRSLTWSLDSNGNTSIRLSLPPEIASAFLNSVEQSLAQLEPSDAAMTQRRADAAVLMAETSLQNAGREMATADRYQVIVSVDAAQLETAETAATSAPTKRPTIAGVGPVARETARRLSCDCSVSHIINANGEPINIGQKTRVWPAAMARAIKARDQHCVFPGCTQSRHLQIHHIRHWADGGSTSVENGACLCSAHHLFVHEGGYRIERVDGDEEKITEQYNQQCADADSAIIDVERLLRNSRESFDYVRSVSPTRFRFRVLDKEGKDIRHANYKFSTRVETAPENSTC